MLNKSKNHPRTLVSFIALGIGLCLVGCAAVSASSLDFKPTALVPETATALVTSSTSASASVSGPVSDPVLSPEAANGQKLFNTFQPVAGTSCSTCHRSDSEERLVGPGLLNVGVRGETRIAGMNAKEYIRQSILSPSAYVVDGYSDIMPKLWGQTFTESQIADIISYLMTLRTK